MITSMHRRTIHVAGIIVAVAVMSSCIDRLPPEITSASDATLTKGGGKGGGSTGDVVVSSTSPDWGNQGTKDQEVVISGSGFAGPVAVAWERGGTAYEKITVHSAAVENSTTIRARISIDEDSELGFFDVSVTILDRGKRGVGTELYEVTTAQPIPTLCTSTKSDQMGRGVSEQGEVVGGSCDQAFYWDGAVTHSLGAGWATAIDRTGTLIAGQAGIGASTGLAVIWRRTGSAWVQTELPVPVAAGKPWPGRANVIASDASGNAAIIGGRIDSLTHAKKNTYVYKPGLWFRDAAQPSGWRLQRLPPRAGAPDGGPVNGVSETGVAISRFAPAAVWEPDGNGGYISYLLGTGAGETWNVSPDGNLIVGAADGRAAYWKRSSGQTWSGPHYLHSACGSNQPSSRAEGVNAHYLIIGWNCSKAAAWKLHGDGSIQHIPLPGVGSNRGRNGSRIEQQRWPGARCRRIDAATRVLGRGVLTVAGGWRPPVDHA